MSDSTPPSKRIDPYTSLTDTKGRPSLLLTLAIALGLLIFLSVLAAGDIEAARTGETLELERYYGSAVMLLLLSPLASALMAAFMALSIPPEQRPDGPARLHLARRLGLAALFRLRLLLALTLGAVPLLVSNFTSGALRFTSSDGPGAPFQTQDIYAAVIIYACVGLGMLLLNLPAAAAGAGAGLNRVSPVFAILRAAALPIAAYGAGGALLALLGPALGMPFSALAPNVQAWLVGAAALIVIAPALLGWLLLRRGRG